MGGGWVGGHRVKLAVYGLEFNWFSRDRLNFDPFMGILVHHKSTYRSASVQPSCQILAAQSLYFEGREVSPLSEYKSSVGRYSLIQRKCLEGGIGSVFFCSSYWLNEKKLSNLWVT